MTTDHPRIRGEHISDSDSPRDNSGSSPHTRGAHLRLRLATRQRRIIPAYAGSTLAYLKSSRKGTDHPRIRGEHHLHDDRAFVIAGSSPHTRGAHYSIAVYHRRLGIIPAYAGSTRGPGAILQEPIDHPRIRGEHPPTARPRLRSPRIIPAYAGSTHSRRLIQAK